MTHNHTHVIAFICQTCAFQFADERDKLLAFVREISNLLSVRLDDLKKEKSMKHVEFILFIEGRAKNLLKEPGFEND